MFKKYIDLGVPFNSCNLSCDYCYVNQRTDKGGRGHVDGTSLQYSIAHMRKAMSLQRLGGSSIINLCAAGETMLAPFFVELTDALLSEGHYVTVVTNATLTNRFKEIASIDAEKLKRLFFKCSFHFQELKSRNLFDTFFDNIRLIKEMGAAFSVEFCAVDSLEAYMDEIKEICMKEVGAFPHVVIPRVDETKELMSVHSMEEFYEIWKSFDSPLFDFKAKVWGQQRTEFCHAGEYMFNINGSNGNYSKCYKQGVSQNIFENLEIPIQFEPVGINCKIAHCFNSHLSLSLGCIPEMDTPSYAQLRDKINVHSGEHWLNETFQELFSHIFEGSVNLI